MLQTLKWEDPKRQNYYTSRFRSPISSSLPEIPAKPCRCNSCLPVHYNLVQNATDPNDIFALGAGGRIKPSKKAEFNVEVLPCAAISLVGTGLPLAGNQELPGGRFENKPACVFPLHFTNSNWYDGKRHSSPKQPAISF